MIHHVDKALESFLRQQVPLPESDVDLSFRAPESSWTASLARPTVDVFLWDIAQSDRSNSSGRDQRVSDDGRRQQRPQPKQVSLRYFVTVWAREQRDEHELLGAVLRTVLRHDALPHTLLPSAIAESAWRLSLAGDKHRLPPSLWAGAPAKPGLYVEIELGVDAAGWQDRGAPVEEMRVEVADHIARPPAPAIEPDESPPLRRFRSGAALVMEGRPGAGVQAGAAGVDGAAGPDGAGVAAGAAGTDGAGGADGAAGTDGGDSP
ncbi:MAG TPA: Pvc16 family protein [Acidimicrobiales bacterium]|nr:Pvc16 family protein [Acidimicrobiales bacterium]